MLRGFFRIAKPLVLFSLVAAVFHRQNRNVDNYFRDNLKKTEAWHAYSSLLLGNPLPNDPGLYANDEFQQLVMNSQTCAGNNTLHCVVQQSPETINSFIESFDSHSISALATQVNNKGWVPLVTMLIENQELKENNSELNHITSSLFSLTKSPPCPELSVLIDKNSFFNTQNRLSPQLKYNLDLAIEAVNHARTVIKESPGLKALNKNLKEHNDHIDQLAAHFEAMNEEYENRFSFAMEGEDAVSISADVAMEYQTGNCGELSTVVYMFLKRNACKSPYEMMYLENGNHEFVVIGRAPGSIIHNPKTWGPNAVIADAFTGKVFPASEIAQKLQTHSHVSYDKYYQTFLSPFNPRYNRIELSHSSQKSVLAME